MDFGIPVGNWADYDEEECAATPSVSNEEDEGWSKVEKKSSKKPTNNPSGTTRKCVKCKKDFIFTNEAMSANIEHCSRL